MHVKAGKLERGLEREGRDGRKTLRNNSIIYQYIYNIYILIYNKYIVAYMLQYIVYIINSICNII